MDLEIKQPNNSFTLFINAPNPYIQTYFTLPLYHQNKQTGIFYSFLKHTAEI